MRVSDVLKSKGSSTVFTIAPDATVSDLLDSLAEHDVGALVVSADGTELTGIVTERDVVRKLRGIDDPGGRSVDSIMTPADVVFTCTPSDSFSSLMATMTEHRVRHVPVVGEDGAVSAVLSIGDAVKFRMDALEFERDQLNEYVSGGQ